MPVSPPSLAALPVLRPAFLPASTPSGPNSRPNSPASVFAVAAVIRRLQDTRKQTAIETPTAVEVYSENQYMALDMSARRNLELTRSMMTGDKKHSLLWVIDKTKTPMGKRLIRRWLENPLLSIPKITRRQNAVAEMTDAVVKRDKIRQALTGVTDMERLVTRIVYGAANARELRTLCAAIGQGADELKRCRSCGKPFQAKSNRALYCPRCAAFEQRKKTRERVRRHRGQM